MQNISTVIEATVGKLRGNLLTEVEYKYLISAVADYIQRNDVPDYNVPPNRGQVEELTPGVVGISNYEPSPTIYITDCVINL